MNLGYLSLLKKYKLDDTKSSKIDDEEKQKEVVSKRAISTCGSWEDIKRKL